MKSRCFIILGMHRSATSLVAKGLHEAGINMGKRMLPADRGNPQGYWEDTDFVNMNKFLLQAAGGNWYSVPPEEKIAQLANNKKISNQIRKLVEQKSAQPLWGWKDPRTVLTIKLYRPFLPEHFFFCCLRNPHDVAASLEKRNNLPVKESLNVAHEYNRRLLDFMKEIENQWTSK